MGGYAPGDYVVYVPEGAVVPDALLKEGYWDEKNNKGLLAGSKGNRVKAIKLRDVLSRGIMFPAWGVIDGDDVSVRDRIPNADGTYTWKQVKVGDDVAEFLGITKFVPEIPASMAGDVVFIGQENTIDFDVENIQKFSDLFVDGMSVTVTEKIHGTFCGLGFVRGLGNQHLFEGDFFCFSKGLGAKGLVFKNNEANVSRNVYVKALLSKLEAFKRFVDGYDKVFFLGEVFGKGIQDLHYGKDQPEFGVFDVVVVKGSEVRFLKWEEMAQATEKIGAETVPLLFKGPWSQSLRDLKNGTTTLANHVREGIVIRSEPDGMDRVMLQDINPADPQGKRDGVQLTRMPGLPGILERHFAWNKRRRWPDGHLRRCARCVGRAEWRSRSAA